VGDWSSEYICFPEAFRMINLNGIFLFAAGLPSFSLKDAWKLNPDCACKPIEIIESKRINIRFMMLFD
jgi:hypothetical protein